MRLIIKTDGVLRHFHNQIGALGGVEAHRALARALNRTTNTVHGRVVKAIRRQSDIPTSIIRASVGKRLVKPGGGGALEGEVWAKGKPLSLKVFNPRQLSYGVRVKFGKQWHRIDGAFMGPRPGVIASRLAGHVFVRAGKDRTPILLQEGPSVPEEMVRDESARVFEQTVGTMLPERVAHELGRLLP